VNSALKVPHEKNARDKNQTPNEEKAEKFVEIN
jgi:hypothetical protein